MKKYKIFGLLTVGIITLSSCNQNIISTEYEVANKKYMVTTGEKIYSNKNHYVYKVENPLDRSPNTFESWIKVPKNSVGGMIAGNYMFAIGTTRDVTVDWGVDIYGRFRFVWGCKGIDYSFPDIYLNNNTWCHVALTRDPVTHSFKFYLNGELKGETHSIQLDAVEPAQMVFGSDNRNWTIVAEPFDGSIREINMYNATLSSSQILEDYNRGVGYNESLKEDCIGSWYLGDEWTQTIIENKVGNNNAYLASQDKFVPVSDTPDFDYTILALPDIQTMVDWPLPRETWYQTNKFIPMMQWVSNNIEKEKMVFSVQVGDIVDNGNDELQWDRAEMGYDLWNNKLPYSTCPGNHDYMTNLTAIGADRDLTCYNNYFGTNKAQLFKEFGGTYDGGIENSYYLFETCGVKYCVINLEIFPRASVLRWASRVCEMFPERRVIINTHYYNDYYNRISDQSVTAWGPINYKNFYVGNECGDGSDIWNSLVRKHKNIFMTLSGHFNSEDALVRTDIGDCGNPIINVLIDEQCTNRWGYGGTTWSTDPIDAIMLLKFNETKKEIYFRYYSPENNAVYNLQNQFTYSFKDWKDPLANE